MSHTSRQRGSGECVRLVSPPSSVSEAVPHQARLQCPTPRRLSQTAGTQPGPKLPGLPSSPLAASQALTLGHSEVQWSQRSLSSSADSCCSTTAHSHSHSHSSHTTQMPVNLTTHHHHHHHTSSGNQSHGASSFAEPLEHAGSLKDGSFGKASASSSSQSGGGSAARHSGVAGWIQNYQPRERSQSDIHSVAPQCTLPFSTPRISACLNPPFDDPVQSTTDDACVSKLSAVVAGYYEDPYIQYVVRKPSRRSPLINRGYFARVAAIRKALAQFVDSVPKSVERIQVVNLGAGLDTTAFWLQQLCWPSKDIQIFELDFPEVIFKKALLFAKKEGLREQLGGLTPEQELAIQEMLPERLAKAPIRIADFLCLVPTDLRELVRNPGVLSCEIGFDSQYPTLFLSECALVYMRASEADNVISWAASLTTAPAAFVIYEQVHPNDAFGRTMVTNLEMRGCPLLSIHDYPTLQAHEERFLRLGWDVVSIADLNDIYDRFLDKFEVLRVQNLELFDEIEEWRLIQAHYFVGVAVRGPLTKEEQEERFKRSFEVVAAKDASVSRGGQGISGGAAAPVVVSRATLDLAFQSTTEGAADAACSPTTSEHEAAASGSEYVEKGGAAEDEHRIPEKAHNVATTMRKGGAKGDLKDENVKKSADASSLSAEDALESGGTDTSAFNTLLKDQSARKGGYLASLGEIWDPRHAIVVPLPRFTTAQLRSLPPTPQLSAHSPQIMPGPMSPLMRPGAMAARHTPSIMPRPAPHAELSFRALTQRESSSETAPGHVGFGSFNLGQPTGCVGQESGSSGHTRRVAYAESSGSSSASLCPPLPASFGTSHGPLTGLETPEISVHVPEDLDMVKEKRRFT